MLEKFSVVLATLKGKQLLPEKVKSFFLRVAYILEAISFKSSLYSKEAKYFMLFNVSLLQILFYARHACCA